MKHLISVIVPVYNAENFIDRCVESIVTQTYKNLEIILVNDGSSDNSGELCTKWATRDDRIKVLHKKNGGAGEARNFGVEKSCGEYIAFVDSDDIINSFYFEFLYNNLIEYSADISCCDLFRFNDDYKFNGLDDFKDLNYEVMSGYDVCKKMILNCDIFLISPCCKLIKTEIVKKCCFPTGCICEDEATSCRYYYYSNKVVLSDAPIYGYFDNNNGVMHSHSSKKISDCIQMLNYRTDFFIDNDEHEMVSVCINSLLHFLLYSSRPEKKFNKNIFCFIKKYWFNKDFSLDSRKSLLHYFLTYEKVTRHAKDTR